MLFCGAAARTPTEYVTSHVDEHGGEGRKLRPSGTLMFCNDMKDKSQEMRKARQLACPLCCKSVHDMQDVWNIMDNEAQNNPMPVEYANWMVGRLFQI